MGIWVPPWVRVTAGLTLGVLAGVMITRWSDADREANLQTSLTATQARPTQALAGNSLYRPTTVDDLQDPCAQPIGVDQVNLDNATLSRLKPLNVVLGRRCAGLTTFYQASIDPDQIHDFEQGLSDAQHALAAEAPYTPIRRVALLVFSDAQERIKGELALGVPESPAAAAATAHAPAFNRTGDIWIDASQHDVRAKRLAATAHELTHVMEQAAIGGKDFPQWLNEGFATYQERTLPMPKEAVWLEAASAQSRRQLLDSVAGKGPPPFQLHALESATDWDANYKDSGRQDLQYAQALFTTRWLVDRSGSDASIWQLLEMLRPARATFDAVFHDIYGVSVSQMEQTLRETWSEDARRAPDGLDISLSLAAGGVQPDTVIVVRAKLGGGAQNWFSGVVGPGDYHLSVSPTNGAISADGGLAFRSAKLAPLDQDGLALTIVNSGNSARGQESVQYALMYGRWSPSGQGRALFAAPDAQAQFLPGPTSAPFGDGNRIMFLPRE